MLWLPMVARGPTFTRRRLAFTGCYTLPLGTMPTTARSPRLSSARVFMHEVEGHEIKAPEWCRVKAFKKGIEQPTSPLSISRNSALPHGTTLVCSGRGCHAHRSRSVPRPERSELRTLTSGGLYISARKWTG